MIEGSNDIAAAESAVPGDAVAQHIHDQNSADPAVVGVIFLDITDSDPFQPLIYHHARGVGILGGTYYRNDWNLLAVTDNI